MLQAWSIKTRRNMFNVQFSTVDSMKSISTSDISFLINCTDLLVRFGTVRSGRKCFFRAYILGSVLNKWNVPVVMNVGLYDLSGKRKRRGHCWLTLNEKLFSESHEKTDKYRIPLATGVNGIKYWHASDKINTSTDVI